MKPLTKTMLALIEVMRKGPLYRHGGGYWTARHDWHPYSTTYGTSSVEALVSRGIAEYTEWVDGKRGRFPVEVRLVDAGAVWAAQAELAGMVSA